MCFKKVLKKEVATFALAMLLGLTLLPATALAGTATTLWLSCPGAAVVGQEVLLTATLNANASPVANQKVEFYEGGTFLGTATTSSGGTAEWRYHPTAAGIFTMEARFVGDSSYGGSSATDSLTVDRAETTTTLSCGSVEAGQPVMLSAAVSPVSPSEIAPNSGDAWFYINGSLIETVSLDNSNEAVYMAVAPVAGEPFAIEASYQGNSNYIGSTSSVISPTVERATPSVSGVGTYYYGIGNNTGLTIPSELSGAYGSPVLTMTVSGGGNSVSVDRGGPNGTIDFVFGATELNALPQGAYDITVSSIGDTNNEAFSAPVGMLYILPMETTPNVFIDYVNETLDGLIAGEPYYFSSVGTIVPFGTTYPIDESWMGGNIHIVKQGDFINTHDSEMQTLPIPARPSAPNATGVDETAAGANDGKITGLDETKQYEYKLGTQANYTSVPADSTEITGLAPGAYDVRMKATTGDFAGVAQGIVIGAFTPPAPTVKSVTISPRAASVPKGATQQFSVAVDAQGGASTDVTWSVNSTLSTIDQNGLLSVGQYETADTLTITVTSAFDDTKKDTAMVAVAQCGGPYSVCQGFGLFQGSGTQSAVIEASYTKFLRLLVDGVVLDPAHYTVTEGSTIITLHESYLKTLANGEYQVRAIFTDGQADILLTVDVSGGDVPGGAVSVTGVTLDKPTAEVIVGKTVQLIATVAPEDATYRSIIWESSDTSVVTVDESGLVRGIKAGKATVTVTTNDGEYTATCEVTARDAAGLSQTGDGGHIALWIIAGLSSILAGACLLIRRKRQRST